MLRNASETDTKEVYDNFNLTHSQTDFLLTYPDENSFDIEQERKFLIEKELSSDEIELCAIVDGRIVGTAGIEAVGRKIRSNIARSLESALKKTTGVWALARH